MRLFLLLSTVIAIALSAGEASAQRRHGPKPEPQQQARPPGGVAGEPTREEMNLIRMFPTNERLAVTSFNGKPLALADRPVFTLSDAQRMTGFGGCNSVSGDFRLVPRAIRFGPLNFTTAKCSPEVNQTELAVFRAIQYAETWKPAGSRSITIAGRAGTLTLAPAF